MGWVDAIILVIIALIAPIPSPFPLRCARCRHRAVFHWYLHLTRYISTRAIHYGRDLQRSFLSRYTDVRKLASSTVGVSLCIHTRRQESSGREGPKTVSCRDYAALAVNVQVIRAWWSGNFQEGGSFTTKIRGNLTEWAVLQINSSELWLVRCTFACKWRKLF